MSVRAVGGQHPPARGSALASPSCARPRPQQHLALPVDADVVGVLPTRGPVHHGRGSLCVEVETLGQAVEGTGFHTPWQRSRDSYDATKEREEGHGELELGHGSLILGLPTTPSWMSLPSRGTQAPSLLISTKSRPLNWTLTHGQRLSLLHSLGNTGNM